MFLLTYPKRNESVFFYDFAAIWCEKSFRFEHICIWPIVWISKDPIQDWKYCCIFGNCVSLVIDIFQGFMRNCHGGNTTKSLYLHDTGICVRQPNMRLLIRLRWLFFWPEFFLEFMKNYNAICIFDRFFWRIVMKILFDQIYQLLLLAKADTWGIIEEFLSEKQPALPITKNQSIRIYSISNQKF